MASQLSQQNFSMTPNQSLIQYLSILPESENKVRKRTFCNQLQPDKEQVFMATRFRFENLQRQRKKGGGRKDAGYAFVADAGGRLGGKHYSSPSAQGRVKGRVGRGWRGRRNHKDGDEEQQKVASSRAGGGKADREKEDSAKCKRCSEMGHKSAHCPDQICRGKDHSAEVCANVITALAYENTKSSNNESDAAISGEEEEAFVCDMSGESSDESEDEGGYSALAWQVEDLTVICDSGASCHMSHTATGIINYRVSNTYMRTASGARYPIEGVVVKAIRLRSAPTSSLF